MTFKKIPYIIKSLIRGVKAMSIKDDKLASDEELIDKKLEFIFGVDEIKPKDLLKIKSLLVDLYEEKYGSIPILNL